MVVVDRTGWRTEHDTYASVHSTCQVVRRSNNNNPRTIKSDRKGSFMKAALLLSITAASAVHSIFLFLPPFL